MIASPGDKPVWHLSRSEGVDLETIYDWITVAIFAGLVVLFLQRSTGDLPPRDSMLHYMFASAGCAFANYFGNKAVDGAGVVYHVLAVAIILGTLAFVHIVLRPLDKPSD
jgi:hypothetical protein